MNKISLMCYLLGIGISAHAMESEIIINFANCTKKEQEVVKQEMYEQFSDLLTYFEDQQKLLSAIRVTKKSKITRKLCTIISELNSYQQIIKYQLPGSQLQQQLVAITDKALKDYTTILDHADQFQTNEELKKEARRSISDYSPLKESLISQYISCTIEAKNTLVMDIMNQENMADYYERDTGIDNPYNEESHA